MAGASIWNRLINYRKVLRTVVSLKVWLPPCVVDSPSTELLWLSSIWVQSPSSSGTDKLPSVLEVCSSWMLIALEASLRLRGDGGLGDITGRKWVPGGRVGGVVWRGILRESRSMLKLSSRCCLTRCPLFLVSARPGSPGHWTWVVCPGRLWLSVVYHSFWVPRRNVLHRQQPKRRPSVNMIMLTSFWIRC